MKKIVVNTENLGSALILLGYESMDAYTYSLIMNNLLDNIKSKKIFRIQKDDIVYECQFVLANRVANPFSSLDKNMNLKSNYDISVNPNIVELVDTEKYLFEKYTCSLNSRLIANYIIEYIDLEKLVSAKKEKYIIEDVDNYPKIFGKLERNLRKKSVNK
ncbi:MAG: hypothetical protein IJ574_03965 [Bacilli bacterium]|nr:hypothetical protein [Bacilli bacterium]